MTADLDPSSIVPVYYQLKVLLRKEIAGGVYLPGEVIPSEHELTRRYGISRSTVRQALADLVQEGLLERIQGKGTFVAQPKLQDDLLGRSTFKRQMEERGLETSIRVLQKHSNMATKRDQKLFGIESNETMFRLLRLISVSDEPVFIESWDIPQRHCPGLLELDLGQAFYSILIGQYKLPLHRVVKFIEPALADDFEADVLGIKRGSPVLLIERGSYPPTGDHALVMCKWIVRGDRCRHLISVGE